MRRLWVYISGYECAAVLSRAINSVRESFPDPDQFPLVYADGRYEKFAPGRGALSEDGSLSIGRDRSGFCIEWPFAAQTEFLKRSSGFAGLEGDGLLILDADETVFCPDPIAVLNRIYLDNYLVRIDYGPGRHGNWAHRLFRISSGMGHWGAHEVVVTRDNKVLWRNNAATMDGIAIRHEGMEQPEWRESARKSYYYEDDGLYKEEIAFRRACL